MKRSNFLKNRGSGQTFYRDCTKDKALGKWDVAGTSSGSSA